VVPQDSTPPRSLKVRRAYEGRKKPSLFDRALGTGTAADRIPEAIALSPDGAYLEVVAHAYSGSTGLLPDFSGNRPWRVSQLEAYRGRARGRSGAADPTSSLRN
jgi:hypothetical protein